MEQRLLVALVFCLIVGVVIVVSCYVYREWLLQRSHDSCIDGYRVYCTPYGLHSMVVCIYRKWWLLSVLPITEVLYVGSNRSINQSTVDNMTPKDIEGWYRRVIGEYQTVTEAWDQYDGPIKR